MKLPSSEEEANDEILLVMNNKRKHPKKKGEYKEQKNGRTHNQEDKRTTYKGKPQGGTSTSLPPSVVRNISNNEREN